MSVTPRAALAAKVTTGGTAVTVFPGNLGGGFIQNPVDATDQGVSPAEPIYVDPTGADPGSAPGEGNGTTFVLYPGSVWNAIAKQSTVTKANAPSDNHQFSAVYWERDSDEQ